MFEFNAAVSTVVGAVIALGGVWITNWATNRRFKIQLDNDGLKEKRAIIRDRGEELYTATCDWATLTVDRSRALLGDMRRARVNQPPHEDDKGLFSREETRKIHEKLPRLQLLVGAYFHALNEPFEKLVASQNDLFSKEFDYFYIKRTLNIDAYQKQIDETQELKRIFESARDAFLSSLARVVRET